MEAETYIYIVMSQGIVFGAYWNPHIANAHANTILGATVVPCELRSKLPKTVIEDLYVAEYCDEDNTPVIPISFDDILKEPK